MVKRSGLGKGLSALIPEKEIEDVNDEKNIVKVPINLIKPNDEQARKNFDSNKLMELAQSIKEYGIIQPLILKKDDKNDSYLIIAGERRWRASKIAEMKEVPAIVMNVHDTKVLEVSLIENIQREDLNPIEEALAYKKLIQECNLTQKELSSKIGKSRVVITNCMRLLCLDERVQQYLIDDVITEGHGRAILGLDNKEDQYLIAQRVIDDDLSVRETENLIKNIDCKTKDKVKKQNVINPYHKDIKERLQNFFGTKVELKSGKNKKGKIEIEYYSDDDLQRIIEMLNL